MAGGWLSPRYILDTQNAEAAETLQGSMVRKAIDAGEPVLSAMIAQDGDAGFMAAMLNPGMRAVSIRITEDTGAGGFILPNDRVDVIMTREVEDESGMGSNGHEAQTILQNIRVLAIGQTYQGADGERCCAGQDGNAGTCSTTC